MDASKETGFFKNESGKQRVFVICFIFFVFAALMLYQPKLGVTYAFWIYLSAIVSKQFFQERFPKKTQEETEKYPNLAALSIRMVVIQTVTFALMVVFFPALIDMLGAVILTVIVLLLIYQFVVRNR